MSRKLPHLHGLTEQQDRFCREYIKDLNATQSAIRAGYSEHSAGQIGHELYKKPEIQERVRVLQERRLARLDIDADYVLSSLKRIAESAEDEGDRTAAIKAHELLAKNQKLLTDKIEHSGTVTLESLVAGEIKPEEKK